MTSSLLPVTKTNKLLIRRTATLQSADGLKTTERLLASGGPQAQDAASLSVAMPTSQARFHTQCHVSISYSSAFPLLSTEKQSPCDKSRRNEGGLLLKSLCLPARLCSLLRMLTCCSPSPILSPSLSLRRRPIRHKQQTWS